MIKELVCITCPMGCHLQIECNDQQEVIHVTGNHCQRGAAYAKKEMTAPERMFTSTVRIKGAIHPLLPVMSEKPVPKEKMFDIMEEIRKVCVQAPIAVRTIIIENVCDTKVNLIASRTMEQIEASGICPNGKEDES